MNAPLPTPTTDEFLTDDASILRYRRAILRLSDAMVHAAGERVDLSPLLLEALNNALENLLLYGDVAALESLEEWLDDGEVVTASPRTAAPKSAPRLTLAENDSTIFPKRRADAERRTADDRRNTTQGEDALGHEKRFDERRVEQRRLTRDRRA